MPLKSEFTIDELYELILGFKDKSFEEISAEIDVQRFFFVAKQWLALDGFCLATGYQDNDAFGDLYLDYHQIKNIHANTEEEVLLAAVISIVKTMEQYKDQAIPVEAFEDKKDG